VGADHLARHAHLIELTRQARPARSGWLLLVTLLSWGAVALAVVLQHGLDMQPCAWCTLQRLIFLVVGLWALVGWLQAGRPASWLWVAPGAALCVAGLMAALYQQFVAVHSQSCALSIADHIIKGAALDQLAPWLFKATAFCHEANVPWLGVPFAIWSAALFVVLEILFFLSALVVFNRPAQSR
jgi:protein dithiol:quinone oxidoreductase